MSALRAAVDRSNKFRSGVGRGLGLRQGYRGRMGDVYVVPGTETWAQPVLLNSDPSLSPFWGTFVNSVSTAVAPKPAPAPAPLDSGMTEAQRQQILANAAITQSAIDKSLIFGIPKTYVALGLAGLGLAYLLRPKPKQYARA